MLNIVIINIDNQLKVVVTIILSKGSTPVEYFRSNLSLYKSITT